MDGAMPSEVSLTSVGHEPTVQELKRELAEARQREAATAAVLKTIGRSVLDLAAVLDILTETAVRLCGADKGLIRLREGERYILASTYAFSDKFKDSFAARVIEVGRGSIVGWAALEQKTVHIP